MPLYSSTTSGCKKHCQHFKCIRHISVCCLGIGIYAELQKFLSKNLAFYACLALNCAAFGLKLFKLVGNPDLTMQLAKSEVACCCLACSKSRIYQLYNIQNKADAENCLAGGGGLCPSNFSNIFTSSKLQPLDYCLVKTERSWDTDIQRLQTVDWSTVSIIINLQHFKSSYIRLRSCNISYC